MRLTSSPVHSYSYEEAVAPGMTVVLPSLGPQYHAYRTLAAGLLISTENVCFAPVTISTDALDGVLPVI